MRLENQSNVSNSPVELETARRIRHEAEARLVCSTSTHGRHAMTNGCRCLQWATSRLALTGIALMHVFSGDSSALQCSIGSQQTPDAPPGKLFGSSFAFDGQWMAVGEPVGASSTGPGLVHFYKLQAGEWVFSMTVQAIQGGGQTGGIGDGDGFGWDVDIMGDTCIVSAPYNNNSGVVNAGAAYVYELVGESWVERAMLTSGQPTFRGLFGFSVSVDRGVALIGAGVDPSAYSSAGIGEGSAYVFAGSSSDWTLVQQLGPGVVPASNTTFGANVALGPDCALVGDYLSVGEGRVYAFEGTLGNWSLAQTLMGQPTGANYAFGEELSVDGSRLLVGAPGAQASGASGAAYLFAKIGGSWIQNGVLHPSSPQNGASFGQSVSLDGNLAMVGEPFGDVALPFWEVAVQGGNAYVFRSLNGVWTQYQALTSPSPTDAELFGYQCALFQGHVLVGTPYDDKLGLNSGSFYHWYLPGLSILTSNSQLSTSSGGVHYILLDGPESLAGNLYMILGSGPTSCPGIAVSDHWLPLTFDHYLLYTFLYPNTGPLSSTIGFVSNDGSAQGTFTLPAGSDQLNGITINHAGIVFELGSGKVLAVSESRPLTFVP